MGKTRPPYPAEFKEEAVRLCKSSGRPRAEIARELGVSNPTLHHWIRQDAIDSGQDEGLKTADWEELKRLRRENRVLRVERAILKKAAAFFAREASPR